MLLRIIFVTVFCAQSVFSRPDGATAGSCNAMTPRHGDFVPQITSPPISIIVPDKITSGTQISVIIRSNEGQGFRGYMILARDQTDNFVGRFFGTEEIRTLACGQIQSTAATHTNAEIKTDVVLQWEAPLVNEDTNFNFIVTIVQSFDTFWINHQVSGIIVSDENIQIPTSPPSDEINNEIDQIYNGCDETKTCFGIPHLCFQTRNCAMLGAVTYEKEIFIFELLSMNNHNYIAMGLSLSQSMGDSSVIECVRLQAGITSYTSWTVGTSEAQRSNIDPNIIRFIEGSAIDGRIYCKVERITQSVVRGVTFDLENTKYYLLLASGTSLDQNSVGIHDNEGISHIPILLTIPQAVGLDTSQHPLMLTHGALMIIAWIGLSSIGIVMARYFKEAWPNVQVLGKDMWFVWHITCNFFTWAFTIIGFILIFVYRGEWRTSAHAIMGCIVLFFTVIQPIGALFRPDLKSESRPLFNWLHKAFGNITHALAIITIFYAVRFPRAGLPHYTLYILAAFVSFNLLMHIIFTSIKICGEIKQEKKIGRNASSKQMHYNILNKTLLGFFITVVITFVIMLHIVFMLDFD